jgi:5''-nucleotidase/2'',3''-cyclic phosphodiesterase and related esterases
MPVSRRSFLYGAAALPASLPLLCRAEGVLAAPPPVVPQGAAVLTLLHTNDMHGHAYLPGKPQGLARLATLIDEVRADMPNVLLIDAGDICHGTPEEREFNGLPLLTAMNALKYDVAAAGNHEFDFGQKVTRAAIDFAKFPVLSANVVDERTGKPWGGLKPYTVLKRGGVRVGIFGLTTMLTVDIQWPRTLAGIQFREPLEEARKMVDHLRRQEKVDVVIALSHLGYQPDREFAQKVDGIDVILGGHSHTTLNEQVWINGTLITQTGAHGRALCRIDLIVQPAKGTEPGRVLAINGRDGQWWSGAAAADAPLGKTYPNAPLIRPTAATPEHAGVVQAYAPFFRRMSAKLDETLTTAVEPLPGTDATKRETPLGNLLAEAVLRQTRGADVALFSSGQFRAEGLDAGPVTVRELYTLMGSYTRQHVVVVRAEGGALKAALTRAFGDPEKYPVHIAPGSAARTPEAVDPGRTYTVAAAAHVIQDYLLGKPGVTVVTDDPSAPTVRDAAIAFLRGHAPLRNTL